MKLKIIVSKKKDILSGGLLFADKYIQIATYLPSANVFGFGDHVHKQLMRDLTRYTTWPMFARDIGPDSKSDLSTQNLYGVHPFYIAMEADGNAHGVFFLNSNAQASFFFSYQKIENLYCENVIRKPYTLKLCIIWRRLIENISHRCWFRFLF